MWLKVNLSHIYNKETSISYVFFVVFSNINAVNNQAAFYGFIDIFTGTNRKFSVINNGDKSCGGEITHEFTIISMTVKENWVNEGVYKGP